MSPEEWLAEQDQDDPAVQTLRRALEGDEDARREVVLAVRALRVKRGTLNP